LDSTSEFDQANIYPLDVSTSAFNDMTNILKALGNEDSLAIFLYAQRGIRNSKKAIKELNLTQKRFYSRLKDLLDNNLIEKIEGEYRHTVLGKIFCDVGLSMEKLLLNKEQLDILNTLQKSSSISHDETREIAKALDIEMPFYGNSGKVKLIESYDDLVDELCTQLENSEEAFYIASKYADARVTEVVLKARERGIQMYILNEKISLQSMSAFKLLLNPSILGQFSKLLGEFKNIMRQVKKLVYSFTIIDSKTSIIEIPHPNLDSFYLAFVIENEKSSKKLEKIFLDMWNSAGQFKLF
jgi:predicted transcriptional regulator